jgi:hypothetical protein
VNALITLSRQIADLERRLRIMEGTQRSGLGSIQTANGTTGVSYTSYDSWSNLGGDAPEITMNTGSRVVILAQARVSLIGTPTTAAPLKSQGITLGVGIDSTEPDGFALPVMRNQVAPIAVDATGNVSVYGSLPTTLLTTRPDLEPGEHTFKLLFFAEEDNPSGTDHPLVSDTSLIVIPLGYS